MCYNCTIIDLYNNCVIACVNSEDRNTEFVKETLSKKSLLKSQKKMLYIVKILNKVLQKCLTRRYDYIQKRLDMYILCDSSGGRSRSFQIDIPLVSGIKKTPNIFLHPTQNRNFSSVVFYIVRD